MNKHDTIHNSSDSIPNDSKCWRWESPGFFGEPHMPDDGSDDGWMDQEKFVEDSVLKAR